MHPTKSNPRRRDWIDQAACAGMVPFGETATYRAVCNEVCPVRELCLNSAIVNQESGLWGGMDDKERKAYSVKHGAHIRKVTPVEPIERPYASVDIHAPQKTSAQLKRERATRLMSDPSLTSLMQGL